MRGFHLRPPLSPLLSPASPLSRPAIHSTIFARSCPRRVRYGELSSVRWASRCVSTTAAGGSSSGECASSHLATSATGSQHNTSAVLGPLASQPLMLPAASTEVLCARLSRRQMRQRERRWGALWRYRLDSGAPSSNASPTSASGPASLLPEREGRQRGDGAATVLSSTTSEVFHPRQDAVQDLCSRSAHVRKERHVYKEAVASSAGAATATPAPPSPQEQFEDPLVAFLQSDDEDAAVLLAMWTSLHRSCVYASALSESVVLQVRYLLHALVHSRAITAAVYLYHRLLGVGVQLQHSDLLLLFSSLAYEGAAATEEAQLRRAAEQAAMDKDRRIWAERRRHCSDAAQRTRAAAAAAATATTTHARQTPAAGRDGGGEGSTATAAAAAPVSPPGASRGASSPGAQASPLEPGIVREAAEAHPPSAIARRVAFHQQPEWIKRWILYEASMGTLDGLDGTEEPTPSTASHKLDTLDVGGACAPGAQEETCGGKGGEATAKAQSLQALRVMEVAAIVDHLHLLTVGVMQRGEIAAAASTTAGGQRRTPLKSRSSSSPRAPLAAKAHWREALQVVRLAYAVPQVLSESTAQEAGRLPSTQPAVVPLADSVALQLQSMVREVQSWEGALAVLRLTASQVPCEASAPRPLEMTAAAFRRGAALFVAMAAASQPWKTQAALEAFMHTVLLPRLAHDDVSGTELTAVTSASPAAATAAAEATRVLWMSHLCGVKASRPDDFVALAEETATYLGHDAAQAVLRGDLSLMAAAATAGTLRAVASLRRAAQHTVQSQRTLHALATSVRTGAFRVGGPATEEPAPGRLGTPFSTNATGGESSAGAAADGSRDLVDAFALCCAALRETLWLQYTTAVTVDPAAATAAALKLLERGLHESTGLYAVFDELYGTAGPPHGGEAATTPAAASERGYVGCLLAVTLLQLVQLLCAPPGHTRRRFGAQLWCGAEVALLLEMTASVLGSVTASQLRRVPWKWAAEAQVTRLVETTAATTRAVVRDLGLHRHNEKALFGSLPEQELEVLAQLARVLVKSSALAVMVGTRASPARASHLRGAAARGPWPVWRALAATCSPRVLQGVQLCFSGSSALSRRVRHRLSRRDVDGLQQSLPALRSRRAASTSTVATGQARGFGRDFELAVGLRDAVYAAVQGSSTSSAVGHSLEQLALATSDWKASLMLCQLTTRDVALARGTCGVGFFAATLDRMSQDLAGSRVAPQETRDNARRASSSAGRGAGPTNLWLSAIDVFWAAVDHAGGVEAAAARTGSAADEGCCPPASPSAPASRSPAVSNRSTTAEARERAVLAQLLQPLLRFSRAVRRRDVGLEWRRAWAAQYTPAERQSPAWRRQNIEALSLLGDPAALTRCVADFDACGGEALLCGVALRHGDWHAALEAIFKTCGTLEARQAEARPYSPLVARTTLQLLARSPMNLSNTAMRVRAVQGEAWDAACGLEVVDLLLRARRWRLALQNVDAALELPAMVHVKALLLVDPAGAWRRSATEKAPDESALTHYALLLTRALQATAIGGDDARAPAYYDAFKALHRYVFAEACDSGAEAGRPVDGDAVGEAAAGRLGDALDMAHPSPHATAPPHGARGVDEEGDSVRRFVSGLAPRARLHFFRAMTKKLLTTAPSESG